MWSHVCVCVWGEGGAVNGREEGSDEAGAEG